MINLKPYVNKSILILAGGTSTLDAKWENLDYDFVWTCNNAYKEERISNIEIDLYLIANNTDVTEKKLINKLNENIQCKVIAEPVFMKPEKITPEKLKNFSEEIKCKFIFENIPVKKANCPLAYTTGAGFRLINLALMTEASSIYFSGFDGWNSSDNNKHAFNKIHGRDQELIKRWKQKNWDLSTNYQQAFKYFLTYKGYNRLQNLGEGFDYNLGTPISSKYFPLRKEIKEKITK